MVAFSIDHLLNYNNKDFDDVYSEIIKVTNKVKPYKIGADDKHKNWNTWTLVEDTFYGDLEYYKKREWNAMAIRLFPKLVSFIESLPIQGIGRVIIMSIPAGKKVPIHVDEQWRVEPFPEDYEGLLNIQFGPKKKMFMYDAIKKQKTYFSGRINLVDVSKLHGIDMSNETTYSVRVDAKLKKDFLPS